MLLKRVGEEFRNGLFHFIIKGVFPEHHPIISISEKLIKPNILLIFPVRFRETSKSSVLFCGIMRIWKPHLYFAVMVVLINIVFQVVFEICFSQVKDPWKLLDPYDPGLSKDRPYKKG